jgi:hypothetical protein
MTNIFIGNDDFLHTFNKYRNEYIISNINKNVNLLLSRIDYAISNPNSYTKISINCHIFNDNVIVQNIFTELKNANIIIYNNTSIHNYLCLCKTLNIYYNSKYEYFIKYDIVINKLYIFKKHKKSNFVKKFNKI